MNNNVVLETVSENRRGRPRLDMSMVSDMCFSSNVKTHRGRQNTYFLMLAMRCLDDGSNRFPWLHDLEKVKAGIYGLLKTGILVEIGRAYPDIDLMIEMAERICEIQPATIREGARIVRQWRLNREPQKAGNDYALRAMCKAVDDLLERYPATPLETIIDALEAARFVVVDMKKKP